MTSLVIILLLSLGLVYTRPQWFFLTAKPESPAAKYLTTAAKDLIDEFRAFVSGIEGGVVPEEAEDMIKAMEEHVKLKALPPKKEGPWLSASGRPMLAGDAWKEWSTDFDASKTCYEKANVIIRWHKKGYYFAQITREWMLKTAEDEDWRNALRDMFDEQDTPVKPELPAPAVQTEPPKNENVAACTCGECNTTIR